MLLIDIFMTIAPIFSYYSQYSLMEQNKSVGSFSIDVCAILIMANILRICFWFTTGFASNLFIQSFLVIGIQFVILKLCIDLGYKKKEDIEKTGFWRWNNLSSFIIFSLLFTVVCGLITFFFLKMQVKEYGTILGLTSLGVEATLAFPQLITNQVNRSVAGLSVIMILCWFMGDFLKTIYFIIQNQPFQFILSGSVQLTVDTFILLQILAFKEEEAIYENVKQEYEIEAGVAEGI